MGLLGLAGCSSDGDPASGSTDEPARTMSEPTQDETTTPGEDETGEPPVDDWYLHLVYSVDELVEETSRGAGKDKIPSIDDPEFAPPEDLTFPDEMLVFGVAHEGVARAYPQRILVYHEIVNGRIGGVPVTVTYCPLTGTVQGFERGHVTFGVSGLLINNNLVMYDRGTETLWPQIPATAIDGPLVGESLREFPLVWTSLGAWREAHPDTTVLIKSTGYVRRYGQDPYGGGYDTHPLEPNGFYENEPTLYPKLVEPGDELGPKEIVIGVQATAAVLTAFQVLLPAATVLLALSLLYLGWHTNAAMIDGTTEPKAV